MEEHRNYPCRVCLLGALSSTVCLLQGTAFAQDSAPEVRLDRPPVIRSSADLSWPPFSIGNKAGKESVQADTIARVAGRVGFTIDYVHTADWPEIKDKLNRLAIDLASGITRNLGVASLLIRTSGLGNLKFTGLAAERVDLSHAARADDPELGGIIDKALAAITEEERLRVFDEWLLADSFRTATGSHVWKFCLVGLIFAASIISVILIWNRRLARELARRRKAEDSLRESESTFRNLFETMQDAYFLTRPGGEIQLVNAEAVRMLQLGSRRFLERLNIATFFEQPGERDRVMEELNLQGTLRDYPLEFARADGSLCACPCNIQILRDTSGEQIAIEYIARWDDPKPPTAGGKPPTAGGA